MKNTKMKTLRGISLALAAILAMGTFTACGTKTADKDDQGRTIISIPFSNSWDEKTIELNNKNIENFQNENPDVVIEKDPWEFDLKTFYAKAEGGQLPTLYEAHFTEAPQITYSEYAADLTDALKKHGFDGLIKPEVLDIMSKDGKVYGTPYTAYVLGINCNMDMFRAAGLVEEDGTPKQPKTWDEMAEFAVKIKEATGKPGMVLMTSANCGGWIFTPIAWSYGVDFMEQDADGKWKATFNTPEAAAALQWVKDLKWKYDVLPANTIVDLNEGTKLLATGNAAMLVDAPRDGAVYGYGMKPDSYGMMAIPAGPKRWVNMLGGAIQFVSNKATEDQIDAAVRYIKFNKYPVVSDEKKQSMEEGMKVKVEKGQPVGLKEFTVWSQDAESVQYSHELIDKYCNMNPNNVRLYNEHCANIPCELQPEEPVCAQELYAILDQCIQEVLGNKDADPATVLEKANSDFQVNYLDNLQN